LSADSCSAMNSDNGLKDALDRRPSSGSATAYTSDIGTARERGSDIHNDTSDIESGNDVNCDN
jgi:hypothetical protein